MQRTPFLARPVQLTVSGGLETGEDTQTVNTKRPTRRGLLYWHCSAILSCARHAVHSSSSVADLPLFVKGTPSGLVQVSYQTSPCFELIITYLAIKYSLLDSSSQSPTTFPLQLVQATAGYHHLIKTLGISAKRVIVAGGSAGTHIALSLIRCTLEHNEWDIPRAILLFSPWCDMTELVTLPPPSPELLPLFRFLNPDNAFSRFFSCTSLA